MSVKNKKSIILALIIFAVVSSLFISPKFEKARSQFHSRELKKQTTANDNVEKTDYVDENGRITIAADLGYATVIITKKDHSIMEQYYDDQGEPISRYNGYFALLREYDNSGNDIHVTYLNRNCEPIMTVNGYAIEERVYNENRQKITERYYDVEGNPVQTPLYGHGECYEYNQNGKVYKITYIDAFDAPMITGQGYASITRDYYPSDGPWKNLIEKEMYFDENGNPICLTLGQYGIHKEYDKYNRVSALTYLNANGEPTVTKKGYTTIMWTYHPNNSIETERYYDLEGNPFALSEGQYGIKRENDREVYLNRDGKETFNIRTILYNHSWLVILIAVTVIFISAVIDRKWNVVLLSLYICAIFYFTLLFRDGSEASKSGFLWYYRRILVSSEARADIIKNIWLFIPLGAILYQLYPKKIILLVPVLLSLFIEGMQLITGRGFCEIDDLISNSLGGWIGFCAEKLTASLFLRINKWKQTQSV